jgi:hypothetical protein
MVYDLTRGRNVETCSEISVTDCGRDLEKETTV